MLNGERFGVSTSKVVCVGRNYLEHIKELDNPMPTEPVLFIKPSTALVDLQDDIIVDGRNCHFETELALLVGQTTQRVSVDNALQTIAGVGLALDLTLRDVQQRLKQQGLPWERAKAFDNSCPISPFVPIEQIDDLAALHFELHINDKLQQQGHCRDMMLNCAQLVSEISKSFTLLPGDIVLTGTPKGVGPLLPAMELKLTLAPWLNESTKVVKS